MIELLEHSASVSERIGKPAWLYREDQYWVRSRPSETWLEHAHRPHGDVPLLPEHGGSKMRMLDAISFADVRGVSTTGTTQSNQVRQIAARLAELRSTIPFEVLTIPDGADEVDADVERRRGNLLLAQQIYPMTRVRVLPRRDHDTVRELDRWITEQQRPDHLWLPRGLALDAGFSAGEQIGRDVALAVRNGRLPRRTLVVLVSGSGTTHVGVARGLRESTTTCIGLCTEGFAWNHIAKLHALDPNPFFLVCDEFARDLVSSEQLERAARRWAPHIGSDVDHQWCARLCLFLDGAGTSLRVCNRHSDSNAVGYQVRSWSAQNYDAVVLLITGVEQRA